MGGLSADNFLKRFLASLTASLIALFARFVTAVHAVWQGIEPIPAKRVYFANHSSHGDFILIWTVLPPAMRRQTRPVAGADYWLTSHIKRFIGRDVFNAVLIDRDRETRAADPVEVMAASLDEGSSLIVFPEGTRNQTPAALLPFKSGLYHLAQARPDIDLVPVWIENLNRVLPKGEFVPIPLICTVTFGKPMAVEQGEAKDRFLRRAEEALLSLAPKSGTLPR
ncbi:MAG TPA: lysophospholipid acyltransferase family protein [Mesorhizobium sp.]|nr:lysophospholipid acyltransferase family protein [Mesorhizobium sp.]